MSAKSLNFGTRSNFLVGATDRSLDCAPLDKSNKANKPNPLNRTNERRGRAEPGMARRTVSSASSTDCVRLTPSARHRRWTNEPNRLDETRCSSESSVAVELELELVAVLPLLLLLLVVSVLELSLVDCCCCDCCCCDCCCC